jgi:hypothetical protein
LRRFETAKNRQLFVSDLSFQLRKKGLRRFNLLQLINDSIIPISTTSNNITPNNPLHNTNNKNPTTPQIRLLNNERFLEQG